MKVTVEQVMAWKPCGWDGQDNGKNYTEARVRKLFGRRKYMTALQILGLDIPYEDRLWGVLREELIWARTLRYFSCDCAERALERERREGREPDPRSWEAVRVSRLYADGKATEEKLKAADAAAVAAARAAAWTAVEAAAVAAAVAAAREAAEAAARTAAWTAVEAAARAAAWESAGKAAWAAAEAAARAAAEAVAEAARVAREAERRWQVEHLKKMLKREKP